jgi:hypothetical protein
VAHAARANLLSRSNAPLARIAEDVGYQTDTAFSRAFRRSFGAPPAAWRRNQSTRAQPPEAAFRARSASFGGVHFFRPRRERPVGPAIASASTLRKQRARRCAGSQRLRAAASLAAVAEHVGRERTRADRSA